MKASKFSDAQKAFILKREADGVPVTDICRKAGISQATYFNWKKRYDGLLPTEMRGDWGVSIRRACRVLEVDTSTYHYKARRHDQAGLEARIKDICATRVRYGYRRVHVLLRRESWAVVGYPQVIRVDQGSEFISRDLDLWAYANTVTLDFSRPGKPTDNAFIEAFNGRFRAECLNAHWFLTFADAPEKLDAWRRYYNRASEHPFVYVIEGNRHCWPGCDPVGYLEVCRARSVMDRAAGIVSAARAKIQGPSGKGWIASTSPASAANLSVLGATCRWRAALLRLSQGSFPSSAGLCTGMR